jgi:hypothetical protein
MQFVGERGQAELTCMVRGSVSLCNGKTGHESSNVVGKASVRRYMLFAGPEFFGRGATTDSVEQMTYLVTY